MINVEEISELVASIKSEGKIVCELIIRTDEVPDKITNETPLVLSVWRGRTSPDGKQMQLQRMTVIKCNDVTNYKDKILEVFTAKNVATLTGLQLSDKDLNKMLEDLKVLISCNNFGVYADSFDWEEGEVESDEENFEDELDLDDEDLDGLDDLLN